MRKTPSNPSFSVSKQLKSSLTQTPTKRILRPLYSTILNDLVDLSLRRAQSELTPGLVSDVGEMDRNIHLVIE